VCFLAELVAATAEAWHIVGLQGWTICQKVFADVLAHTISCLPVKQQLRMQQVQQLITKAAVASGSMSWLELLIGQPLCILGNSQGSGAATTRGSDDSRPIGATILPVAGTNAIGRRGNSNKKAANSAIGRLTDIKLHGFVIHNSSCFCHMQRLLAAAADAVPTASTDPAVPGVHWAEGAQAHLAAAQAAAAVEEAGQALMHVKAAVRLCRKATAGFLPVSSSRQGSGVEMALHWHALGLTMAGLLQLSELVEQSGNPQDALRLLKEVSRLSCSCHCSAMTALSQAGICSISSRMGKAAAAAEAAEAATASLRQHLHQSSSANNVGMGLISDYVTAVVTQAQAACSSLHQSNDKAQLLLQESIENLGNGLDKLSACDEEQQQGLLQLMPAGCWPAANMTVWKVVDLRAKLQLQLSHMLQGTEGPQVARQQLLQAIQLLRSAKICQT
jgi:hypothetical protein